LLAKSIPGLVVLFSSLFLPDVHDDIGFQIVMIMGGLWILATAAIDSCTRAAAESAAVGWRKELVLHLQRLYFKNDAFYHVSNDIDNAYA
jgi:hypothetical protein